MGDKQKALATMRRYLPNPDAPPNRFNICYCAALTYAGLGQRDEAFARLEQARRQQLFLPVFPSDARFDSLRGDPRYARLAASILEPKSADRP